MSLADSTRTQYEGRIRKIEKVCFKIDTTNITQEQINKIVESFENQQTCKGMFSALLWYCKSKNAPEQVIQSVQTAFNKLKEDCKKTANNQELTPKQLENYMSHTDVLTLYNKATGLMDFESKEYNDNWIYYTIVCLYAVQPPVRADYWNMSIVEYNPNLVRNTLECSTFRDKLNKYIKENCSSEENNFCIITPIESYFVFNNYKTAKTYGQQVVAAEWGIHHLLKHLRTAFDIWKVLPIDTPNALVKYVKKAFLHFGGKETTIGLLRHSYIVEFYKTNPSLVKKQELARKMLHSVNIQEQYRSENIQEDDI